MELKALEVSVSENIATVCLDRPPVNAVDQATYKEIRDVFTRIEWYAPGADVVVLRGRGRHFCAGNDLNEFVTLTPENSPERMKNAREAFWAIYDCPVPVIAAVHGTAAGTGLALAASSDLVVAASDAKFSLPEINVGVLGGAKHLSRLAPQGLVRRMHYTGDALSAGELAQYGGIADVVERTELLNAARSLAERIARHSPAAIRMVKKSLNRVEFMSFKEGYEIEQGFTGEMSGHADSKEAVAAFFERRDPQYLGR